MLEATIAVVFTPTLTNAPACFKARKVVALGRFTEELAEPSEPGVVRDETVIVLHETTIFLYDVALRWRDTYPESLDRADGALVLEQAIDVLYERWDALALFKQVAATGIEAMGLPVPSLRRRGTSEPSVH